MKQNKETIKSYFETGDKPTQEQYHDTWDSFWHKDEVISQSAIENLQDALLEENIKSTVLEPSFASSYTFNTNSARVFLLTLTENCVLAPPSILSSRAVIYTAIITGDFDLDLTAFTITPSSDNYKGTGSNRLVFDSYKDSLGNQTDLVTIENLD